jgi:TonB family protein
VPHPLPPAFPSIPGKNLNGGKGWERKRRPILYRLNYLVMIRRPALLLVLIFSAFAATAHADSVKDALNHQYKKQVLAARAPFTHRDEEFDSAGKLLNTRPADLWLVYGGIYVEKLSLSSDRLRLEGPRGVLSRAKKGKPVFIRLSKSVRIDIHLDQPLHSFDEAQTILNRIFFLEGDATQHAAPEFRRSDDNTPDDEIYHVKKDNVLPPRPTYTPEPEFSEEARRARFQGIVVLKIVINKEGNVVRVRLERALGMGLDQNAMEGVERWRFTPATRNGQPVAVEMNIEVAFNLY